MPLSCQAHLAAAGHYGEEHMSDPEPTGLAASQDVRIDPDSERGYVRDAQLQRDFDAAAERLREADGYVDPADPQGRRQLRADLALEGGGVKGIGLAGEVLAL